MTRRLSPMRNPPALSPAALALWLMTDVDANTAAMADLIVSGDVKIVAMQHRFGLVRGHDEPTPRFGRADVKPTMTPTRLKRLRRASRTDNKSFRPRQRKRRTSLQEARRKVFPCRHKCIPPPNQSQAITSNSLTISRRSKPCSAACCSTTQPLIGSPIFYSRCTSGNPATSSYTKLSKQKSAPATWQRQQQIRNYLPADFKAVGDIGIEQYLRVLAGQATTIINAPEYGKIIHELSIRRELIKLSDELCHKAFHADPADEPVKQIEEAESRLASLKSTLNGGVSRSALRVTCVDDVEPEAVKWVWPDRFARGHLTLMSGAPGTAKTQISCDLTARITTSAAWPDSGVAPLGSVVMLSAEDPVKDVIRPRLEAAGADLQRVKVIEAAIGNDGKERTSICNMISRRSDDLSPRSAMLRW